jgi:hypothetical protein
VVYNADPASAVIITGIPGYPIEDVDLNDIHLYFKGGGTAAQAAIIPKEDIKGYPEPGSLGTMPAYGFYLRHVHGITLRDVETRTLSGDQRPVFALEDVSGIRILGMDAQHAPAIPLFSFKGVTDFSVFQVLGLPDGHKDSVADGTL